MKPRDLISVANNGLSQMWEPDPGLFCFRLKQTPMGLIREGVSRRYTLITLLGLQRYEISGGSFPTIGINGAVERLVRDCGAIDNVGDLGLLLWLCALACPEYLEDVCAKVDAKSALSRFRGAQLGITMELAWFLSGLAHAAQAGLKAPDLADTAVKTFGLLKTNQGDQGIFGHLAQKRSLAGVVRGRIGSFADQVYPIYALTKFSQAYGHAAALNLAKRCAEAICRAQGPLGQWWWHYDAGSGEVVEKYPVYNVHQDGMGPMALFALAEASQGDFSESIYKGLAWIDGRNEMNIDLCDSSAGIIWRSIYRRRSGMAYIAELWKVLRSGQAVDSMDDLDITFECRPYELGWLMYAFAGRGND